MNTTSIFNVASDCDANDLNADSILNLNKNDIGKELKNPVVKRFVRRHE